MSIPIDRENEFWKATSQLTYSEMLAVATLIWQAIDNEKLSVDDVAQSLSENANDRVIERATRG